MPLGDGYLSLILLLVFDAFSVVRLEHHVPGDWECVSRFLAISLRGLGSSNLLDMELVFCCLNQIVFGLFASLFSICSACVGCICVFRWPLILCLHYERLEGFLCYCFQGRLLSLPGMIASIVSVCVFVV